MALNSNEKHTEIKENAQKERRKFVKKAVYSAPVFIQLGTLFRLRETKAVRGAGKKGVNDASIYHTKDRHDH